MPVINTYTQFGGAHPETAALTNALAAHGLRAPHTGQPYSEALLLGIGGGLGAGYIMWEFNEHHTKVLVLGFHNQFQYTTRYYQTLCDRIGVTITMPETGSRKAAAQMLNEALLAGKPAVAWVDRAHMPYLQMPAVMQAHFGHLLGVCGIEDDDILVDDLAAAPFRVSSAVFANARDRITSFKNRLLLLEPAAVIDLKPAVLAGLRACVEHLSSASDSFSLPTLRKWGKMMTDAKNKKGWLALFKDTRGLYFTLRSVYEGVALNVGGGGLREVYAHFLGEAAAITGLDDLHEVEARYRDLAAQWLALADAALPDAIAPLAKTKALLRERHEQIMQGGEVWRSTQAHTQQLDAMSAEYNRAFPLDEDGIHALFEDMQTRLFAIYEGEKQAVEVLGKIVHS